MSWEAWLNVAILSFALGWRGSTVILWVAGDRANFNHHRSDPNSAFMGPSRKLSAAPLVSQTTLLFPFSLYSPSWDGLQGKGRAGTVCRLSFFCLLICVHCFSDALWGKAEKVFISPISIRIIRSLKYHLELQWQQICYTGSSSLEVSYANEDCLQEESYT